MLLVASPSSFSPSSPLPPPSHSFSLSGSSASSSRSLVGLVFSPVIGWPARSTYKEGNFARKLKLKRAAPPLSLSLRRWPKGCACSLVREKKERYGTASVTRQIYFCHASRSYENSREFTPGRLILLPRANAKYLSE